MEKLDDSVVANFATTASDGKTYNVDHYSLDMIISVGYRVKSKRGNHIALEACLEYLQDKDIDAYCLKEDVEFFNSLPITMTVENEGLPDIVICHGSPRKVNEKFAIHQQSLDEVVAETNADYIICGHTHKKMEALCGTTHSWNPESVGASIDAPFQYRFMILHGAMLNRAMEICIEENGSCEWPMVPEACYAKAFGEIVKTG